MDTAGQLRDRGANRREVRAGRSTDAADRADKRLATDTYAEQRLFGPQKSLVRTTCSAVVGKRLKVRMAARFYEAQPHIVAACHARHLNGGLKARAGRRCAGDLHCILIFKRGTQRHHESTREEHVRLPTANQIRPLTN